MKAKKKGKKKRGEGSEVGELEPLTYFFCLIYCLIHICYATSIIYISRKPL